MNETLKQFKENQKRNQEKLEKLLDFIHMAKNTASLLKNPSKTKSVMRLKMWPGRN